MSGADSINVDRRPIAAARLSGVVSDGPYRLRSAAAVQWQAAGYRPGFGLGEQLAGAVVAVGRSILPVLFLTLTIGSIYLYLDHPAFAAWAANLNWLKVSHLLVPVAYFTVHVTNRRYGPSYAFAQLVLSFLLCAVIVVFLPDLARDLVPARAVPSVREVAAFVAAFVGAGFFAIVAFDGARGPRWWTAPLIGSLVAAVTFALFFYPLAYAATDVHWPERMLVHSGLLVAAAFAGLFPFWMLRDAIPPLPGFGGY